MAELEVEFEDRYTDKEKDFVQVLWQCSYWLIGLLSGEKGWHRSTPHSYPMAEAQGTGRRRGPGWRRRKERWSSSWWEAQRGGKTREQSWWW